MRQVLARRLRDEVVAHVVTMRVVRPPELVLLLDRRDALVVVPPERIPARRAQQLPLALRLPDAISAVHRIDRGPQGDEQPCRRPANVARNRRNDDQDEEYQRPETSTRPDDPAAQPLHLR